MAVQINNLKNLLDIRRMNRIPNARIRELYGVKKWLTKGLMKVFSGDRIATRVNEEEGAGSRVVGRPWKRWIDSVKDFKKKVWM